MTRKIGFSTGVLYKTVNSVSSKIIQICHDLGCTAVEINCHLFPNHVIDLNTRLSLFEDLKFEHVSLHLPCNMNYQITLQPFESSAFLILLRVFEFHLRTIRLSYILVHPDLVTNWSIFEDYPIPVTIENMDHRKNSFLFSAEIESFFEKYPNFKFVFDVNHYVDNGGDADGISNFIEKFKNKLIGIHLSGIDESRYHVPLFKTQQHWMIEPLASLSSDIPIIIESVCRNTDEMARELDYIQNYL